jgi:NDP-sugar pyrophosphorylase family protein
MKAMILAAGFGTRLKSLTKNLPKPLMPVKGVPAIYHVLETVRRSGISEVIINLHYLGEKIESELGSGGRFGMKISYSREPSILGTGGGIKRAQRLLGIKPFLVINSDILCNINLTRVIRYHRRKKGIATMVVRRDPVVQRNGEISLGRENRVQSILGRPPLNPRRKRMFCGIHVLEPGIFDYLKPRFSSIIRDFYIPALEQGHKIWGYDYRGYWADFGTPGAYAKVSGK